MNPSSRRKVSMKSRPIRKFRTSRVIQCGYVSKQNNKVPNLETPNQDSELQEMSGNDLSLIL